MGPDLDGPGPCRVIAQPYTGHVVQGREALELPLRLAPPARHTKKVGCVGT